MTEGGTRRLEELVGAKKAPKSSVSTAVSKILDLDFDLGNMLALDPNPLPDRMDEEIISRLSRENTQLLVNELWKLPTTICEDVVMAKLPDPSTALPRAKPVPMRRPLTKWEEFAKTKGIRNEKKDTKVWDEDTKTWKYTWGYRKKGTANEVNDYKLDTEMPDPSLKRTGKRMPEEPRKKLLNKAERVAKNNLGRLKNVCKSRNFKDNTFLPPPSLNKAYVPPKEISKKALAVATASTASMGRFTKGLKNEKKPRTIPVKSDNIPKKTTAADEKNNFVKIFENFKSQREEIDTDKALSKVRRDEQDEPKERLPLSKTKAKKKDQGRAHHSRVPLKVLRKGKGHNKAISGKGPGAKGGKVTKKKAK
jgi:regulator of ribosome biosynthesis